MEKNGSNGTIGLIDRFNEYVARGSSYLILLARLAVVYEIFSRYVFKHPTSWSYEISYMLCSAFWLLGGAWTLKIGRHVNVDVIYGHLSPRTQLAIDIVCYLLLLLPVAFFVLAYGTIYAWESWSAKELSHLSPWHPPIYPFKTLIPLTFFMLIIQGIAEVVRTIRKLKEYKKTGD
ncbi:MAG: C4-dicarboxylate ABC transporter permease [Deltaproteobacteria bacterium]|nr:MAG: C4-dicarboxylate ABC transporter permease [Deltaproteobacteria bacterium]